MADAFRDELFSMLEDDSTMAPGAKKDKEKEKGKWKGPPGSAEKARKCFDGKLQSESTNVGKIKRDADFEGADEPIFGKKPRVEESITEDLSLADLMPRVKMKIIYHLNLELEKLQRSVHSFLMIFKEKPFSVDTNQSVLVSAHTSAGKTVCAEYAIALALREKQRVIFTSPVKALSNQKYQEMYEEFQDGGLMTGDATINSTASYLVMITEILRSMLYRGSEIM
ncbi:hypothetical protein Celaphus_00005668 [Cervus elaphus hippelaphus]|uniref:Helicase ATP-binding domain-containing protein n=1 Tax=Cervus elaphus hippelaphus TaxID=46360 RepID=A0A212CWH2_CEREH|nr:hypothetical protein Celaphus_00005668 [Cervus elaphus hippelaphus]